MQAGNVNSVERQAPRPCFQFSTAGARVMPVKSKEGLAAAG